MVTAVLSEKENPNTKKKKKDEIQEYLNCRWMAACNAIHRIFEFPISERSPAVQRLACHLKREEAVYMDEKEVGDTDKIKEKLEKIKNTSLTAWFENNRRELDFPLTDDERRYDIYGHVKPKGVDLLYREYTSCYTWNNTTKKWKRRENIQKKPTISRLYSAHPRQGRRFYLRLLLNHVRGATCFADLRTSEGIF